jgi:type II secretory pathway pseudopilin PulG
LTEVVVAVALIGISGAGVISALGYGFNITQAVRENQRATQVILEKVETLRLYNWEQVNSNNFIPSTFTEVYDPQEPARPGLTYHGSVALTSFPGSYDYHTNMRLVTISLNWTDNVNHTHTRTLTTSIARDGVQNYVW